MMKAKLHIPSDTWGPLPWHKARLELQGFMRQNKHLISEDERDYAYWLYGTEELCKHHTPPWSTGGAAYVKYVYEWIKQKQISQDKQRHDAETATRRCAQGGACPSQEASALERAIDWKRTTTPLRTTPRDATAATVA